MWRGWKKVEKKSSCFEKEKKKEFGNPMIKRNRNKTGEAYFQLIFTTS